MKIKFFAFALLLLPSPGQEAPNRFKKTADLPKNPDDLPVTVVSQIEHFLVPKEILHQWTANHPNQKITHELVTNWVAQDQATLAQIFFINTRLEKEIALHAGQLLVYPTEYAPHKFSGEWMIPTAFDYRNLGPFIQTVFSQSGRGPLQARYSNGRTRFLGSDSHSALVDKTREPDDLFLPQLKFFKQRGAMTYRQGVDHFFGIFNSIDDDTKALLIFSKAKSITLNPALKSSQKDNGKKSIQVSADLIEVPPALWNAHCKNKTLSRIRTETASWASALVNDGKATSLMSRSHKTAAGVKKNLNPEGTLTPFAEAYEPSDPTKKLSSLNPLVPSEVSPGFLDFAVEVTPEIAPTGHILLTYLCQMHRPLEKKILHRVFDGDKWIADAWTPFLDMFNIRGAIFVNPGENILVGAIPVKTSSDKVRLFFLKAE